MRSTPKPVTSIQDILALEAQKKRSPNKGDVQSGLSHSATLAEELKRKLNAEQLKALEAYVIANYNYRYQIKNKSSIHAAKVTRRWREFLALVPDQELVKQFNLLREDLDAYAHKQHNLRPEFQLYTKTFGLHNKPALLVKAAPATAAVANNGVVMAAQPVSPLVESVAQPQSSALRRAAIKLANAIKGLVSDTKRVTTPAQVIAKVAPVKASLTERGIAVDAEPVPAMAEAESATPTLKGAAIQVAHAVKNMVADSQQTTVSPQVIEKVAPVKATLAEPGITVAAQPVPAMSLSIPVAKPTARKSLTAQEKQDQEQSDHDFALKLQRELDQDYGNDDHLLAIKMQIEEEVKGPIVFPDKRHLHLPTAEKVASDIYSRGLHDMRAKQTQAQARGAVDHVVLGVYIETHSLTMTMTANSFILQEVRQSLYLEVSAKNKSLQIDMYAATSFASFGQFGLFGASASSYRKAADVLTHVPTTHKVR